MREEKKKPNYIRMVCADMDGSLKENKKRKYKKLAKYHRKFVSSFADIGKHGNENWSKNGTCINTL
jgi:hypothetical protein